MEFMNDGVIVVDAQSRVVDINPAALWGLEITANDAVGLHISQLLAGQDRLTRLFQSEDPFHEDITFISPGGINLFSMLLFHRCMIVTTNC